MKVDVHLHATLRIENTKGKGQIISIDLPESSTISDLLDLLAIDLDPAYMLFVLNGRTSELNQKLNDGDVVNLMTAVSGG
jgi:molybdopterin converting factor small subunit